MHSLTPLAQTLFINKHNTQASKVAKLTTESDPLADQQNKFKVLQTKTLEGEYINIGDTSSFSQAQDLFVRANEYAGLSRSVQQGLQAYQSIDSSQKRDTLHSLMGVDLYA